MSSGHPYPGPIGLGQSQHATSEQIAALGVNLPNALGEDQQNSHVQLAVAHGNALKEDVDKHAARFSTVVSSTITNTRRLLDLIREASSNATKSTVEALWRELEELYAALNDTKAALPTFLEKQRNNMSLYHNAMMNQMIKETQDELNIQHKKVNIQHSLILEHQEAFQAYNEQTASKLKDMDALQERVSRLTLEKGNLRTELDRHIQLLEEEHSTKAEGVSKADALQKELETVMDSKKQLLTEVDTLRQRLEAHQDKAKVEQLSAEQFHLVTSQLAEERGKTIALQTMVNTLSESEHAARIDAEKVKNENKTLSEKYSNQAAEYAQVFMKLNYQVKEIESLKNDIGRLQKENTELQQRSVKLADVERQVMKLGQENSGLSELANSLTSKLKAAQDEATKAKMESEALSKKVESLGKAVESADPDAADLMSKQAEKIATLETTLQEWIDLAKRSYQEYKDMLPAYKQAEQYRKNALDKEETIKGLQRELTAAKASHNNGDANYWKNKYETLLASVST